MSLGSPLSALTTDKLNQITNSDRESADALDSALAPLVSIVAYVFRGAGSPEAAVTAPVGSLYMRTNGGAGTCLYVKESGAGNTGWVAK